MIIHHFHSYHEMIKLQAKVLLLFGELRVWPYF